MSNTAVTSLETSPGLSRVVPPEIAEILGDPPVLLTENPQAYDQLMTQLVLEWKPRNIMEWLYMRDIADISWEILRHRRAIAAVFPVSLKEALTSIFFETRPEKGLFPDARRKRASAFADAWFQGPEGQELVKSELARYGMNPEAIVAQIYVIQADHLDKLYRLLALAEARRTAVTRNFSEYRAMSPVREPSAVDAEEVALVPHST